MTQPQSVVLERCTHDVVSQYVFVVARRKYMIIYYYLFIKVRVSEIFGMECTVGHIGQRHGQRNYQHVIIV